MRGRGLEGRDPAHDVDQAAAQQRLATGEPHLGDPEADHETDDAHQLVVGEHLGLGEPVQALGRHAVGAAQVAPVGDRHAQVTAHPTRRESRRRGAGRSVIGVQCTSRTVCLVLRRLATPRWLGALLLAGVLAWACYHLGWWQYHRYEAKALRNERLDTHYRADPVPLSSVLTPAGLDPDDEWTRVTVTGKYAVAPCSCVAAPSRASRAGGAVGPAPGCRRARPVIVDRGWVAESDSGADVLPTVCRPRPGR